MDEWHETGQQWAVRKTCNIALNSCILLLLVCITSFASYRILSNQAEVIRAAYGQVPIEPYNSVVANRLVLESWLNTNHGSLESISKIANRLVEEQPYWSPNWYLKTWVNLAQDNIEGAEGSINRAIEYWPTRGMLLSAAALVLDRLDKNEHAIAIAKRAFWSKQVAANAPLELIFSQNVNAEDQAKELLEKENNDIYGNSIDYVSPFYVFANKVDSYELKKVSSSYAEWPKHKSMLNSYAGSAIKISQPKDLYDLRVKLWGEQEGFLKNGDLDEELVNGPLGWTAVKETVGISSGLDVRNTHSGKASLRVRFTGEENVTLKAPAQHIPLINNNRFYTVTGHWRGDKVTTRGLPIMELFAVKDGKYGVVKKVEGKRGGWDWTKIEMTFDNAENADFLYVRLSRSKSKDLDSKISGSVWLDSFSVVVGEKVGLDAL